MKIYKEKNIGIFRRGICKNTPFSILNTVKHLLLLAMFLVLSGCNQKSDQSEEAFQASQVQKFASDNAQAFSLFNNGQVDFVIDVALEDYSAVVAELPKNGQVIGQTKGRNLSLRYVPNDNYIGQDFLTFKIVRDDTDIEATAKIQFVVLDPKPEGYDSDKDGLTDEDERNIYQTDPDLKDTDKDGLSDGAEVLSYHTSPVMPDTDGDSLNDWYEIVNLAFDSDLDNFNFNPLIADVPIIAIDLINAPQIELIQQDSKGESSTVSTERSTTETRGTEITNSNTQSSAVEESSTESWNVGGTAGTADNAGVLTANGGYSESKTTTTTEETSYSFSTSETQENSRAYSLARSLESSRTLTTTGGKFNIAVKISNKGNMPFTVQNMILSARKLNDQGGLESVIGNLEVESSSGNFPEFSLSRGLASGVMEFSSELQTQAAFDLLRKSRGVVVDGAVVELVDVEGNAFAFNEVDLFNKNATITIDYGNRKPRQNYRVAVAAKPSVLQESLTDILDKILKIPTESSDARLTSINGVGDNTMVCPGKGSDSNNNCDKQLIHSNHWVVIHISEKGTELDTAIYDNNLPAADSSLREKIKFEYLNQKTISQIKVKSGDLVKLLYVEDKDQDGLGIRQEFSFSTDPFKQDSDGDGLSDKEEIDGWNVIIYKRDYSECIASGHDGCLPVLAHHEEYKVYSSPIKKDTDDDQVYDSKEKEINTAADKYATNPADKDTDGDGAPDKIDAEPVILNELSPFIDNARQENTRVLANITIPKRALDNAGLQTEDYRAVVLSRKILPGQSHFNPDVEGFPVELDQLEGTSVQCRGGKATHNCWKVEKVIKFNGVYSEAYDSGDLQDRTETGERIDFKVLGWVKGNWIKGDRGFSYADVPIYKLKISVNSIKNLICGDGDNECEYSFYFTGSGVKKSTGGERVIHLNQEVDVSGLSLDFEKEVFASDGECLDLNFHFSEYDTGQFYSGVEYTKFCFSENFDSCATHSGAKVGYWSVPDDSGGSRKSCEYSTLPYTLNNDATQYSFKYDVKVQLVKDK